MTTIFRWLGRLVHNPTGAGVVQSGEVRGAASLRGHLRGHLRADHRNAMGGCDEEDPAREGGFVTPSTSVAPPLHYPSVTYKRSEKLGPWGVDWTWYPTWRPLGYPCGFWERGGDWLKKGPKEWLENLGCWLYPPFCTLCLRGTSAGCFLCAQCFGRCQPLNGVQCRQCSRPYLGNTQGNGFSDFSNVDWPAATTPDPEVRSPALTGGGLEAGDAEGLGAGNAILGERCADCLQRDLAFECAVVVYRASGGIRDVVHQFKYHGKRYLSGTLGQWLVSKLGDIRLNSPPVDLVVPVPLYWLKLWKRGYNQAALLATEIHRLSGLPVLNVLKRVRNTGSQTRLHRTERMGNLRGAFAIRLNGAVLNRHVLLIDDVMTTGATFDACARVLREAGALSVRALAVARG